MQRHRVYSVIYILCIRFYVYVLYTGPFYRSLVTLLYPYTYTLYLYALRTGPFPEFFPKFFPCLFLFFENFSEIFPKIFLFPIYPLFYLLLFFPYTYTLYVYILCIRSTYTFCVQGFQLSLKTSSASPTPIDREKGRNH